MVNDVSATSIAELRSTVVTAEPHSCRKALRRALVTYLARLDSLDMEPPDEYNIATLYVAGIEQNQWHVADVSLSDKKTARLLFRPLASWAGFVLITIIGNAVQPTQMIAIPKADAFSWGTSEYSLIMHTLQRHDT